MPGILVRSVLHSAAHHCDEACHVIYIYIFIRQQFGHGRARQGMHVARIMIAKQHVVWGVLLDVARSQATPVPGSSVQSAAGCASHSAGPVPACQH